MATKPSSPILKRLPTPRSSYSHPQNPNFENRLLPLPPKYKTPVFQDLNRRSTRSNHRCLRWILYSICFFICLIFLVMLISFLLIKPRVPKFTIEHIKINGFKKVMDPIVLSPNLDVQMRISNPSHHIGVIYEADNSVIVRYAGARLGNGGFPTFHLQEKNSTLVDIHLVAVGLLLSSSDREALTKDQQKKTVPLIMEIRAAIRFKAGHFKTWATLLRASCKLKVNDLVPESILISSKCKSSLGLWLY